MNLIVFQHMNGMYGILSFPIYYVPCTDDIKHQIVLLKFALLWPKTSFGDISLFLKALPDICRVDYIELVVCQAWWRGPDVCGAVHVVWMNASVNAVYVRLDCGGVAVVVVGHEIS